MVVQVHVQQIVESGCRGQRPAEQPQSLYIRLDSFSVEIQVRAGFGPPAVAVGLDGLSGLGLWLVCGWLGTLDDFSVERQLQRGKSAPC